MEFSSTSTVERRASRRRSPLSFATEFWPLGDYQSAATTSVRSGSDVSMSTDSDTSGYGSALDWADRPDSEVDTLSADEAFIDDFYRGAEFYDLDCVTDFHSRPLGQLLPHCQLPLPAARPSPSKVDRAELSMVADSLLGLIDDLKVDKKTRKILSVGKREPERLEVDNIYEEIQEDSGAPRPELSPPPLPLRPSRFVKSASVRLSDDRMSLGQKIRSRLTQSVRFARRRDGSIGRSKLQSPPETQDSPKRSRSVESLARCRLRPIRTDRSDWRQQ